MTVIVTVKINDGIVLASDSAATFANGQIYNNADKIINLVKGKPIGVMVTGDGGIGSESINTIVKDFRRQISLLDEYRDGGSYSVIRTLSLLDEYLATKDISKTNMLLRVCGYGSGRSFSEIHDLYISNGTIDKKVVKEEGGWGVNWAGEYEPLDRLILGAPAVLRATLDAIGLDDQQKDQIEGTVPYRMLCLPAMPIQDAIDLAKYLVEVTIGFVRFSVKHNPKSVGGPIEIAAITKHEGFVWVQRKHFFSRQLNEQWFGGTA